MNKTEHPLKTQLILSIIDRSLMDIKSLSVLTDSLLSLCLLYQMENGKQFLIWFFLDLESRLLEPRPKSRGYRD